MATSSRNPRLAHSPLVPWWRWAPIMVAGEAKDVPDGDGSGYRTSPLRCPLRSALQTSTPRAGTIRRRATLIEQPADAGPVVAGAAIA